MTDGPPTEAGAPSDYTTLQDVLREYAEGGWDGEVDAREGGDVRFRRCGHEAPASELEVVSVRRMEGASDPADMLAVVGTPCPRCGDRAVLVLHYGPAAGPEDSDVLAALNL